MYYVYVRMFMQVSLYMCIKIQTTDTELLCRCGFTNVSVKL